MKTKNNEQMFQAEELEQRMEMARVKSTWYGYTSSNPNDRIGITGSFEI